MKRKLPLKPATCCSPLPKRDRERLAAGFKALGDPTRVAIVDCLAQNDAVCVCQLETFGLSQPTISHHLRVLRDAGLVTSVRRGTWVFYSLVPEAVQRLAIALGTPARDELQAA